ncbi:hypothetical protein IKF04_03180 [Candidatus Saccharibacteria bacterium]|nr:hypothetical protein [Candidatus Saccharibacteria bacterium]
MREKFFSGLKTVVEMLLQVFEKLGLRRSYVVPVLTHDLSGLETAVEILLQEFKKRGFEQSYRVLLPAYGYHFGQFRKDRRPYIWHPIRMALLALMFPGITDDMVATILLHDVIEETYQKDRLDGDSLGIRLDRAGYADRMARSLLIKSNIRESVILLTTLPASDETPEQKAERKEAYFANIDRRLESIVTKLFDRIDNLLDAPGNLSREAIVKNLLETAQLLIPAAVRAEKKYPDEANLIRGIRIILECLTCVLAPIYGVELDMNYPLPDKLDKDSLGRYINKQLATANCRKLSKTTLAILTRRMNEAIDAAILQCKEMQHPHQEK